MANSLNYQININVKDGKAITSVDKLRIGLVNVDNAAVKVGRVFGKTINNINQKLNTVNSLADGMNSIAAPGLRFSTSLSDLSAITGVTGKGLKQIGQYARQSAKEFGTSTSEGVESYLLILSILNPEIAKTPKALSEIGKVVNTLSKQIGGDTVAATETLTMAMNQFQVSTDDPIAASKTMASMINVMAAAQEGSSELPQIKQALEQAGLSMSQATANL